MALLFSVPLCMWWGYVSKPHTGSQVAKVKLELLILLSLLPKC